MIFGYISTKRYGEIEEALLREKPEANVFEFDVGDRRAFFFQYSLNRLSKLAYQDANRLLLADGVPIRHSSEKGYEIVDSLGTNDVARGFSALVDDIISDVNMLLFDKEHQHAGITLSSSRAGPGKFYYRSITDGIAFSTDFTTLLKFGAINLNDRAIYYIIRYGYSPPPATISQDIHAVPTAHWATFDLTEKNVSIQPYFTFDFSQDRGSDFSAIDSVLDLSARALNLAGCSLLLSGGIDSTLFAHKMRQYSDRPINTYYLSFGDDDPELPFAREAAQKAGCSLRIFDMHSDVVRDTILEVADAYPHPFNDYSTIATYYLMKCAGDCEDEGIIFDGNGGDDCFGLGFWLPGTARKQKFWFNLPAPVKQLALYFSSQLDLWEKPGSVQRIFRAISGRHEKEIYQIPLILCPWTTIFKAETREFDQEMGDLIAKSLPNLLKPLPHNDTYNAKATVAWMRHVTCGMWCAKTYGIKTLPAVQPLYPYLWKDMLEEQGKLSWSAKTNGGILKYPLKKLLENYMPHGFIYRQKSGFTPPLERWFANKQLYELLQDALLSQNTATERVINRQKLGQLINELPRIHQWPAYLSNFLWGCLFAELWIKRTL